MSFWGAKQKFFSLFWGKKLRLESKEGFNAIFGQKAIIMFNILGHKLRLATEEELNAILA